MTERKGVARFVLATILAAGVLGSVSQAANGSITSTAASRFFFSGENTRLEYVDGELFTDQEPNQNLANANAYVNNHCPSGRFCFSQRDIYGSGGYEAYTISGCDTFWVRDAFDTFRVNNRMARRMVAYNANRQRIGEVGAGVKRAVTWDPIYYFSTCR